MSNSSTVYIQALTGTLGVVVLILLIAIIILLLRRRNRPKTAWILLASKSQRTQQEEETSAKLTDASDNGTLNQRTILFHTEHAQNRLLF